jgi:hypothetical protein
MERDRTLRLRQRLRSRRQQANRGNQQRVKAKLGAVEAKIVTFEEEFLAHILLPDDTTVGQWARPQIAAAYQSGETPRLASH